MGELRINISRLSEGIHEYSLEASATALAMGDPFPGVVRARAVIEKNSRQLYLRVHYSSPARFVCDRCLEDFDQVLEGEYAILYLQDTRAAEGLEGREEVQILRADANHLDLDDDVRQFIHLAVPQKLLCREDCAGLCPTCGVNLNRASCSCTAVEIDPRWESLRRLPKN